MIYLYKCTNCGGERNTDCVDTSKCSFCGKKTMDLIEKYGHNSVYDTNDLESMRKPDVAATYFPESLKPKEKPAPAPKTKQGGKNSGRKKRSKMSSVRRK